MTTMAGGVGIARMLVEADFPLIHAGSGVIHVDADPGKHMGAPGPMHFNDMHKEPEG